MLAGAVQAQTAATQRPRPAKVSTDGGEPRARGDYAARADGQAFIREMVERHGFAEGELTALFSQVRPNDAVIRLMAPASPGFRRSWQAYRARFLDALRIREGLRFWRDNEATLTRAADRFGVPPEIIVSIIGVETVYGRVTGDFRVIEALATLAFDYPRRADYFRSELEQYLLYARDSGRDVFAARGSYAGAIGLPQFMPGSIRRFAVDFDGDGQIDLQSNAVDAIGSVANFLAEHGWQRGEPVRFTMQYDDEQRLAPLIANGIEPRLTIEEMAVFGVASTEPVAVDRPLALIDLPNADAPASYYLGARNFYVITRYNRSSFYAMAVYELSRVLADTRQSAR
ncbi:MAG: lytic murein transglycosylase B [Burkholderiaceae bacterium]